MRKGRGGAVGALSVVTPIYRDRKEKYEWVVTSIQRGHCQMGQMIAKSGEIKGKKENAQN